MQQSDQPTPNHVRSNVLAGKTAVVTGSSSGIGRAIALELAFAGADVAVHGGHDVAAAERVADEIRDLHQQTHVVVADLSDRMAQDELVRSVHDWRPVVDIWINNAGVDVLTAEAAGWPFEEKLARLWQVDVLATIRLSRMVAARMLNSGGVVVNIGWDQAERGMAGDSGQMFAAAKGAIMAFSRSFARSVAPTVRVNCVAPGWIQTKWGVQASDVWSQRARGESLLERWGTPQDVARVVRFLVSPDAAFVNGQTIPVNGGMQPWPVNWNDSRGG